MNRSFSIRNILTGRAASGLKDTVIGVLDDTSSQITGYLERLRSGQSRSSRYNEAPRKPDDSWKSEAILRALKDRK